MFPKIYFPGEDWDPMEYFNPDLHIQYPKFFNEAFGEEVPVEQGQEKVQSFIANCSNWVTNKIESIGKWMTNLFNNKKEPKSADQILDELHIPRTDGNGNTITNIPSANDSTVKPLQPKEIDYAMSPIEASFEKDKDSVTIKFDTVKWGQFNRKLQGMIKGQEGTKNRFIQTIVSAANLAAGRAIIAIFFITNKYSQKELVDFAELLSKNANGRTDPEALSYYKTMCDNMYEEIKKMTKTASNEYTVTTGEIQEFAKTMAIIYDKIKPYDDVNANFGEEWMNAASDFVKILNQIQYGVNEVTKCMQNVYVINPSYCNTIRDVETLSQFVDKMIKAGIPSKYISFNLYMVSHSDLKGDGDALNPTWGESRCIFFPHAHPESVYKIAINPVGTQGNRIESGIWATIKGSPEDAQWFAGVKSVSENRTILEMERCDTNRHGLIRKTLDMPRMQSKVRQICKKFNIPDLSGDVHPENIGWKGKQPCVIDYGTYK